MTDHGNVADDVIATLEAQTSAALERLQRASTFREGVGELRGHGSSGETRAVVNASGALVAIEFADASRRLSGEQLAAEVMAAVHAAQRDVSDQVGAEARAAWGASDPVVGRLQTHAAGRFGPRVVRDVSS